MARVLLDVVTARKLQPYHVTRFRPVVSGEAGANTLDVPAYRQTRNYCCGFACALMVVHYFEAPVPARELFDRLGTARDGTRQNAIVRELRAAGLRVNVRYDVDFERIQREIDQDKLLIGYLADAEHWVVIYGYGVNPKRIYVADPRPDEGCEHAWVEIGPRLGTFGMVCSSSRSTRPQRFRGAILLPPPAAAAPEAADASPDEPRDNGDVPRPVPDQPRDDGDGPRPAQLSFEFGAG